MTRPLISILIVEDVDEMRILLAQTLAEIPGLRVSGTARNAAEARLEVTRRRPRLVLLDEILPGESSVDLLKYFQELDLEVLLISGTLPEEEGGKSRAVPKGVLGRLRKPSWDTLEADRERIRLFILNAMKNS